jgi:hypothetical protein
LAILYASSCSFVILFILINIAQIDIISISS